MQRGPKRIGPEAKSQAGEGAEVRKCRVGLAAERIQELYLSGRKAEAAEAIPDEYIDEGALVGPRQRIRERFVEWEDSGATGLLAWASNDEGLEFLADLAKTRG